MKTLKEYKELLKSKSFDEVDYVCDEVSEKNFTQEEWGKVFNKTTIRGLLGTEDPKIGVRLSTALWKLDSAVWENFIEEFLAIKKLQKNKYLNAL